MQSFAEKLANGEIDIDDLKRLMAEKLASLGVYNEDEATPKAAPNGKYALISKSSGQANEQEPEMNNDIDLPPWQPHLW